MRTDFFLESLLAYIPVLNDTQLQVTTNIIVLLTGGKNLNGAMEKMTYVLHISLHYQSLEQIRKTLQLSNANAFLESFLKQMIEVHTIKKQTAG